VPINNCFKLSLGTRKLSRMLSSWMMSPPRCEDKDIYFIVSLSWRGLSVNFKGGGHGGGAMMIQEYVNTYCSAGTQELDSQVPINNIEKLSFKIILLMIVRVSISIKLYHVSHPQMYYRVECLRLTFFD
jgi:hypothetical protein